jgi:16S rRNA (cytosine1402-N4)-methyltransferase
MFSVRDNASMGPAMERHLPVLEEEVLAALGSRTNGKRILDATFGGGGHARGILEAGDRNEVVAIDCDPDALARAGELEEEFPGRFRVYDLDFRDVGQLPEKEEFDGSVFDLGVSSFHLDAAGRGFSFRLSGPTDMRMDPRRGRTAEDLLEKGSREELVRAIRDYGEERAWRKVVDAIVKARGTGVLGRSDLLGELIAKHAWRRRGDWIHPATRSFQGIRIAVNNELSALEAAIPAAFSRLRLGGVLAVITFHSLEDRLVKRLFRRFSGQPEHRGDARPQQERRARAEILTKRPVRASSDEVARNPRARSAKLRILKKREEE